MYPHIEWSDRPKKIGQLLESSYELLRKTPDASDEVLDFVLSLPLEDCLDLPQQTREALVCCLSEIIRLYDKDIPISLELSIDLFTITLPDMALSRPKNVLSIIRVFQWYNFAESLLSVDDHLYATNWLEMCSLLAKCGVVDIINSLPSLCVPAVNASPISKALDLISDAPDLWSVVAKKIPDFPDRVSFYFESALENRDPIFDAQLFSTLTITDPSLLGGYKMPILRHWNPSIRIEAVKAYARLDPTDQEWIERHADKDVKVRRQWALSAAEVGYREKNELLYSDADEKVRMHAFSVPPLPEAKGTLFRNLKHKDPKIAWDSFLAYGQLAHDATDIEILVRWMARAPDCLYDALSALRLIFDENIDSILDINDAKSESSFLFVLSHTLKFYNAITTYSSLEKGRSTSKAVASWLDSNTSQWEELDNLQVDEFSSNFKRNAVPLVSAEWAIQNAQEGNEFAQKILVLLSEKSPLLLQNLLPTPSESTPTYMLSAIANLSSKFPPKIVNPTTTILRDICLESADRSWEAAEILYNGSRSFFKAIAPEILQRAVTDPTTNTISAIEPVAKVLSVHADLRPLSMISYVAPMYARVCPQSELYTWVNEFSHNADTETRSNVLLVLAEKRELPTNCLPTFAKEITDEVAFKLAERLKVKRISQRMELLLLFNRKYKKLISLLPGTGDVVGVFARLVYVLAVQGSTDVSIIHRFLECFATSGNISTIELVTTRLKHFELKDVDSSLSLYTLAEVCQSIVAKFRQNQKWSVTNAPEVGLPADSFTPLPLNARKKVVKTRYLGPEELEGIENGIGVGNEAKRVHLVKVGTIT